MKSSQAIVVTGMHRSGTSLVMRLLQGLGVNIGERLLEGAPGNPRGFFEDVDFYELHQAILRRCGLSILVEDAADIPELTEREARGARSILAERESLELWGFKDPRTSLFLDFWSRQLPGARYVLLYRHPVEVVLSLLRRGSDLGALANPLIALRSWRVYNARILEFARRHRPQCRLCHISGFVADIDASLRLVLDGLDVPALDSRELGIERWYRPDELNRLPLSREEHSLLRALAPDVVSLYEALEAEAHLPSGELRDPAADRAAARRPASDLIDSLNRRPEMIDAFGPLPAFYLLLALLEPRTISSLPAAIRTQLAQLLQANVWLDEQRGNWQAIASRHEAAVHQLEDWAASLQAGKEAETEQRATWERLAEEREAELVKLRQRAAELEAGRAFEAEQSATWERLAEEREAELVKLRRWVAELEAGKAFEAEQRVAWEQAAAERAAELLKLQQWTSELEAAKEWQAAQRAEWERQAASLESELLRLRRWAKELEQARVWEADQRASWQAIAEERDREVGELLRWTSQLQEGLDWQKGQREHWRDAARSRGRQAGKLAAGRHWELEQRVHQAGLADGLRDRCEQLADRVAATQEALEGSRRRGRQRQDDSQQLRQRIEELERDHVRLRREFQRLRSSREQYRRALDFLLQRRWIPPIFLRGRLKVSPHI